MTTREAQEFGLQIDREFAEKMRGAKRAVIFIALEADHKVVNYSPVDTSMFKNNWLASVGTPDDSTTENFGEFAAKSVGAIASYAATQGFPKIFIQNNVPYALALERGHSSQAPNGILAITVPELEAIISGMPPL